MMTSTNKRKANHNAIQLSRRFIWLIGLFFVNQIYAATPKPCTTDEYRQFDFWIGEWEVKNASGKTVGHNKIFPVMNGCALSENWTSARGNSGVSYNFYDQAEKKWHQTWVDQNGGVLYLDGSLDNNKMVLKGYRPDKEGKQVLHKISWTPMKDGRVKQHWQSSTDEGKAWTEVFVGFYSKK
ncbi:hypothetical protein [Aliikangiella coralliicola]|uniref:DUF1579 domain-containing protein n=1 Tax=Aliikangiella coralliicola TaxID=2592383 RepID=A0A545UBR9_9GAMM|nr:hypothetical protein [Aliikangiella coralliicola]TQV86873.1 hypothetical protein FLL46_13735 [Aliikangiella coralliicola]